MSQFGMQMPGGARRASSLNVYTGLMFLAVVCLASACVVVFLAGQRIGKGGDAFAIQEPKSIQLKK